MLYHERTNLKRAIQGRTIKEVYLKSGYPPITIIVLDNGEFLQIHPDYIRDTGNNLFGYAGLLQEKQTSQQTA